MSGATGVEQRAPISRGVRVARGTTGACIATLFAAVSHAAAGGEMTALAVISTTVLALPLCVALAGRIGSLWRLTVGVSVSQFLYHWCFAGLGVAGSTLRESSLASPHAKHFAQMESFVPNVAGAASADALMWVAHACAAILTIAMLYRGDRAVLALRNLLRRVVAQCRLISIRVGRPERRATITRRNFPLRDLLRSRLAFEHRGPPLAY